MYVFFSRRGDRVRILYFDRDGYVLVTERLEKGVFRTPWIAEQGRVMVEELLLVFEGSSAVTAAQVKQMPPGHPQIAPSGAKGPAGR
jgi:transposase